MIVLVIGAVAVVVAVLGWLLGDEFAGFGSRSGLLEPFSSTALAADAVAQQPTTPSAPSGLGGSAPITVTDAVVRQQINKPEFFIYEGVRDDSPYLGGFGPRVRVGLLSDGTYGIERWSQAGTRTVGTFS